MPAKKKISEAKPFLRTAAEAIGTALGKLAVKTGVATRVSVPTKRKKAPVATSKKAESRRKIAVKRPAR